MLTFSGVSAIVLPAVDPPQPHFYLIIVNLPAAFHSLFSSPPSERRRFISPSPSFSLSFSPRLLSPTSSPEWRCAACCDLPLLCAFSQPVESRSSKAITQPCGCFLPRPIPYRSECISIEAALLYRHASFLLPCGVLDVIRWLRMQACS